ncbi:MAG: hypothetical protein F4142_03705 [Nitrospira sp. SB0675_bin_23]|nr:hypothetical protein [Nitrospira sp. SB0675_bin_23]
MKFDAPFQPGCILWIGVAVLRGNVTSKSRRMLQRNEIMKYSALGVLLVVLLTASWVGAVSVPFRIQMESWSPYFAPVTATVAAGNPIRWENPTGSHHTITHDGCRGSGACAFDSGPIGPDGTFELAQLPPGQYPYHCMLHPIMRGMLVIVDAERPSEI